jgi:hypothetical protein
MRIILDIPGNLYSCVNTKAAQDGLSLDSVTTMLYRSWLNESAAPVVLTEAKQWLVDWMALGAESLRDIPAGPTATVILSRDRDRLERPL